MAKGRLYVITGPSGAGAGDIAEAVIASRSDIGAVTPVTARKMKPGDVNGRGLYFYDLEGWQSLRDEGDLLEETVFAGNDYGTSRKLVNRQLDAGRNVVLELETARAAQIKKNMPEALCIYIAPTTEQLLRERYEATARNRFEVEVRMAEAERCRSAADFCDVFLASDEPEKAAAELDRLIIIP